MHDRVPQIKKGKFACLPTLQLHHVLQNYTFFAQVITLSSKTKVLDGIRVQDIKYCV